MLKRMNPLRLSLTAALTVTLAACGGSGSNPLGNPALVSNSTTTGGQSLSFVYFQKCINPIFLALLPIPGNTSGATNSCASAGCHHNITGAGGSFRLVPSAQAVDMSLASNTPAVIRTSDMYKNFYSAQSETIVGDIVQSRLLNKPQLLGVLHGGVLVFENPNDANVLLLKYWISHPMPSGQDEFSSAADTLFSANDPVAGTCNTQ
jgi:hypothetical protein